MDNKMKKYLVLLIVFTLTAPVNLFAKDTKKYMSDDQLIEMLDISLKSLQDKISKVDPKIRRVAFYSLKVDRSNITLPLFRQIFGKIEAALLKVQNPKMIYAPELKPLKVVSNENTISFVSGFQSTGEIRDVAQKLKVDGFLEGELYISDRTLYLNLRIFESDNMTIAWSEEFTSITPSPSAPPKMTGVDWGFGLAGIPVSATNLSTGLTIPSYAQYYNLDLRIAQKTISGDRARFTLAGGLYLRYDGVTDPTLDSTIVSAKTAGALGTYFFARVGVRLSLIPAQGIEPRRDWLATDITFGRLFGLGASGVSTLGIKLETDLTKNISMGAGISYIPLTDVEVSSTKTVKAGGLSYEISLLRLNFKP
jgi:hypothetical protein